jgi:hypothetical protein
VFKALGTESLPRGAHVRVRLGEIDEITLDVSGTVTERLDAKLDESPDPLGEDDGEIRDGGRPDLDRGRCQRATNRRGRHGSGGRLSRLMSTGFHA